MDLMGTATAAVGVAALLTYSQPDTPAHIPLSLFSGDAS